MFDILACIPVDIILHVAQGTFYCSVSLRGCDQDIAASGQRTTLFKLFKLLRLLRPATCPSHAPLSPCPPRSVAGATELSRAVVTSPRPQDSEAHPPGADVAPVCQVRGSAVLLHAGPQRPEGAARPRAGCCAPRRAAPLAPPPSPRRPRLACGPPQLLFGLIFIGHVAGCFFFFFSSPDFQTAHEKLLPGGKVTWIQLQGLTDAPMLEQYIASLYWSFTTLTTVRALPAPARARQLPIYGAVRRKLPGAATTPAGRLWRHQRQYDVGARVRNPGSDHGRLCV